MIDIVDYDPGWPRQFERAAAELRSLLGREVVRIDHIGSTAVPGLAAKDRIDVQLGVDRLDRAPAIRTTLVAAGYRAFDIAGDHTPADGPDDPAEWAKAFFQSPVDASPVVNLHVREIGRANWRYALLFRDFLRSSPASVAAYAELKRRLAAQVADIGVYTDIKDPAVDLIMVAAEAWARATGWQPGR